MPLIERLPSGSSSTAVLKSRQGSPSNPPPPPEATLSPGVLELLQGAVKARLSILISGGAGSGKTQLLNAISGFIPASERVIVIDDAAEVRLTGPHMVRLEACAPEGGGYISQHQLLVDALRMQPDRIIVGETRGAEALDVLEAMNTGCGGSMTTIHADSPRDALIRIENMVAMTGLDLPPSAVRQQINLAVDLVIQLARLSDGSRRVVSLQEIKGMKGDVMTLQEIFTFVREGVDENGMEIGGLISTGLRPRFCETLYDAGAVLPADLFELQADRRKTA